MNIVITHWNLCDFNLKELYLLYLFEEFWINITRGHGIFLFFLVLDAMAKKIVAMVATRTFWQLALTFSVLATNLGKYFMLKQLRGESFQKKFTFIFLMLFTLISQLQRLSKKISKEKIVGNIFLQTYLELLVS